MKRPYFQHLLLSGILVVTIGACAHKPTKSIKYSSISGDASSEPQQTVLLKEARTEAQNLRAELASLKILMAKQMGELQSLRQQSQSIQHREQDQGQEIQNLRSQLLTAQAERDQMRKHNMELEGQVASMPDTSQLVNDIQSLRSSFQQVLGSMKELSSDLQLIKQEMHITTNRLKPQQTKMTPTVPSSTANAPQTPDAEGHIVIQEGDTLWRLSRAYKVSVEQLQEWNNMSTDLIVSGLRLQVAEPTVDVERTPNPLKASNPSPEPMPQQKLSEVFHESEPETASETIPNPITEPSATEPSEQTHILSISGPQSDSHEAP